MNLCRLGTVRTIRLITHVCQDYLDTGFAERGQIFCLCSGIGDEDIDIRSTVSLCEALIPELAVMEQLCWPAESLLVPTHSASTGRIWF